MEYDEPTFVHPQKESPYYPDGIHKVTGTRFDENGFDRDGFNIDGCDKAGYNTEGLDIVGFDRAGINRFSKAKEALSD
jgi:hypothetical protein